jgi:metal-sulfur cluster biosynthetic enzyme
MLMKSHSAVRLKDDANTNMFTKEQVLEKLKNVLDPELGISIVDLGLIYNVEIKGTDIDILMTLTTMGCPLFDTIQYMMEQEINQLGGVGKITVELTFEPPWGPDRMTPDVQAALGFA